MRERLQANTLSALVVLGLLLAGWALYRLAPLAILVLIAIVLATTLDPLVQGLQRLCFRWCVLPRALATVLVMLAGLALAGGVLAVLLWAAVGQAQTFIRDTWPSLSQFCLDWLQRLEAQGMLGEPQGWLKALGAQTGAITRYAMAATGAVLGLLGGLFSVLLVLILAFFFTAEKEGITRTLAQLVPPASRARALEISHLAGQRMGGWLRGVVVLAGIIATVTAVGMALLHVPYPLLIGICGGVGEFIPMVGIYAAAAPALLLVLAHPHETWQVVAVLLFFTALMQTENYVLAPRIMQRHVGLSPVTTILAVLVGTALLGVLGVFLAIPLAAAGRVLMVEAVFPAIQGTASEETPRATEGAVR